MDPILQSPDFASVIGCMNCYVVSLKLTPIPLVNALTNAQIIIGSSAHGLHGHNKSNYTLPKECVNL